VTVLLKSLTALYVLSWILKKWLKLNCGFLKNKNNNVSSEVNMYSYKFGKVIIVRVLYGFPIGNVWRKISLMITKP